MGDPTLSVGRGTAFAEILVNFGATDFLRRLWKRRRTAAIIELAALADVASSLFPPSKALQRFGTYYNLAKRLDASAFAQVMGSPYALVWLRRAFDCVRVLRNELGAHVSVPHMGAAQSIDAYAEELLDHFGLIVAAAAVRGGTSIEFPVAVPLRRRTTLAATGFHLVPTTGGPSIARVSNGDPQGQDSPFTRRHSLLYLSLTVTLSSIRSTISSHAKREKEPLARSGGARQNRSRNRSRRRSTSFAKAALVSSTRFRSRTTSSHRR